MKESKSTGVVSDLSNSQLESIEYQKQRYDNEADDYQKHHGDYYSQLYRTEFVRNKLFNFDVENKVVLDAMCASGIETEYLISKNALVTGLDISSRNAELYRKRWNRECLATSIHETGIDSDTFDVVYIYGGLHHIIPCLAETIREVHRILKPGGHFVFVEPNKDTFLNKLRMAWYRMDKRFHETEEALSYSKQLKPYLNVGFQEINAFTGGNIAYLIISQSLVLGTPLSWKRWLYPVLAGFERLITPLPFVPKLYLAATWRKI